MQRGLIDLIGAALHSFVAVFGAWVMRGDRIGALLVVFMLSGCVQDQPAPSAVQALDIRAAATPQQALPSPVGCENLGALPGQGLEYNLFKNMAGVRRCAESSPVAYQRSDGHPVPSQQEDLDRAACRIEGARAANAARGLQPGEYDFFKSTMPAHSGDAEKFEQSCMAQRGYKSGVN